MFFKDRQVIAAASFLALLLVFCPLTARATGPTLTQIHDLNFGSFGMHDNKFVHSVTVAPDGTVTGDAAFVFAIQPQRGEYRLSGLPTNELLNIVLSNSETLPPLVRPSPSFIIKNFLADNPVTTDGAGNAVVHVGAMLQTTGAGPFYQTDTYQGIFDITITY